MNWQTRIIIFCLCAGLLGHCANPVGLVGGAKDETPPRVVKDGALPADMQTNFTKQDITFTFDEWVKLDDAINQIVVSPPLEHTPKVTLKNKELIFSFDEEEVLKEEATYTVNFGEAIRDLTEGNPAELKYVFSTGAVIDSLVVDGTVTDALTGEKVKDCLVMLYKNLSDTIVRKGKPYYFSKTNEQGRFKIDNVKGGVFKVFALQEDQGQRYLFDSDGEGIGFLEEPIIVSDTTGKNIQIQTFKEELELKLTDEELPHYGHAWFAFSREPYDLKISHEEKIENLIYDYKKDSVHIWFDSEEQFLVYLAQDTIWNDTVKIKSLPRSEFIKKGKLKIENAHEGVKNTNKQVGVQLQFSQPLKSINNDQISLYADTTQTLVPVTMKKDSNILQINIEADWKASTPYELVLLPGAVEDMFGLQNDTISLSYLVRAEKDFGEIKASIVELESESAYIIRLLTKSKKEIKRYTVQDKTKFVLELKYMEPGDYMIEVIQDNNKNGRWDTGNYDQKTYPEKMFKQSLETLRANWTLEVSVTPVFGQKK